MIYIFEGLDGSGKSTQAEMLYKHYHEYLPHVYLFREPGGTPQGECIRDILKSDTNNLSPMEQLTLFCLSRKFLSDKILELEKSSTNNVIILDRYIFSTYAYQMTSGITEDTIRTTMKKICGNIPYLISAIAKTIYIDVDPKICHERIKSRNLKLDKFENLNFLKEVHKNYKKIISSICDMGIELLEIDGNRDINSIFEDILKKL
jgi:dTMP kinase